VNRSNSATKPRSPTTNGIVLDHTVEPGNPADAPQLAPAVARIIRRTGRTVCPGQAGSDEAEWTGWITWPNPLGPFWPYELLRQRRLNG
jgi:hypothetical protein